MNQPAACPQCHRVITDPLRDHRLDCGRRHLAASAGQPDPGARTAWTSRIRELRLAGQALDEARGIAGPMPARNPDLDKLATRLTYGILLAAFAEFGFTDAACAKAEAAVAASSAFEEEN